VNQHQRRLGSTDLWTGLLRFDSKYTAKAGALQDRPLLVLTLSKQRDVALPYALEAMGY